MVKVPSLRHDPIHYSDNVKKNIVVSACGYLINKVFWSDINRRIMVIAIQQQNTGHIAEATKRPRRVSKKPTYLQAFI